MHTPAGPSAQTLVINLRSGVVRLLINARVLAGAKRASLKARRALDLKLINTLIALIQCKYKCPGAAAVLSIPGKAP